MSGHPATDRRIRRECGRRDVVREIVQGRDALKSEPQDERDGRDHFNLRFLR
jgi:hypothetical protein